MDWKPKDWIEHSAFGVGRVSEDRGDRLNVEFIKFGAKTILKTAELKPATSPSPELKFPRDGQKSHKPRFRVERPPRRPPLDFEHLLSGFKRVFPDGFQDQGFHKRERDSKEKAARILKNRLGSDVFEDFLRNEHYAEVCRIAKDVLVATTLVHNRHEKPKLLNGLKKVQNQERFAKALYSLLHGLDEMHFTQFTDVLSEIGANKWTIATYYQFLLTEGERMFLKPHVTRRMADSLGIALNYKTEPNWLTYKKLQELAGHLKDLLRHRGLEPQSGIDVQGFIWAAVKIEEGSYGSSQ
jgi:hypothetical protein